VGDFSASFDTSRQLEYFLDRQITRKQIQEIAQELTKCTITTINPAINITGWFTLFEYKPDQDQLEVAFNTLLQPYLLKLTSDFTTFDIHNILGLKSFHSKRLYTILKSKSHFNHSYKIKIIHLNSLLFNDANMKFKYLHRQLKNCMNEINNTTDIAIKFTAEKSICPVANRLKITSITFTITQNSTKKSPPPAAESKKNQDGEFNIENYIGKRLLIDDQYAILESVSNGTTVGYKKIVYQYEDGSYKRTREFSLTDLKHYALNH
jgi:plasmid replication initiation protein